jgi:hypothetical protein
MRDQETEQLAGGHPERALLLIELEVDLAQVVEGIAQVVNEGVARVGLDNNIVNVCFRIAPRLVSKRHACKTIASIRGYKCRFFLIFDLYLDLVVPREGVEEAQQVATYHRVHNLVDPGQGE